MVDACRSTCSVYKKNGKHLWWDHVYRIYLDDTSSVLRRTNLRSEHVSLTPSSRMSVRLGVQVSPYAILSSVCFGESL